MKFLLHLAGLGAMMFCLSAPLRADGSNLLPAPATPQPGQNPAAAWVLSTWNLDASVKGKVEGNLSPDTDGHDMLAISSTESLTGIQMWWQAQGIACVGGASYQLSVSLKGTVRTGTARPTVGVYFMDAAGKWLGFQEISESASTLPSDWQKVDGKVTAPANAAKMGVRIGIVYPEGDAGISYKDPELTQAVQAPAVAH